MHDVLVHYLEVNFAEIAEQLAHAQPSAPAADQRAVAAERLRRLIRQLRVGTVRLDEAEHLPAQAARDLIGALNGELTAGEHQVLERFFDLFARSMERTRPPVPVEAMAPGVEGPEARPPEAAEAPAEPEPGWPPFATRP